MGLAHTPPVGHHFVDSINVSFRIPNTSASDRSLVLTAIVHHCDAEGPKAQEIWRGTRLLIGDLLAFAAGHPFNPDMAPAVGEKHETWNTFR